MAKGKEEEMEVTSEELLDEEGKTEEENPDLNFEDEDQEDSFEIVSADEVSDEDDEKPKYDEQIASLQQQLQSMQQMSEKQETSEKQNQKMDQLAEILREMKKERSSDKEKENKPQQIDWKKKRAEWQENIWDKPLDILDEYTNNTVGPVVNQLQGEISRLKRQVARQNAKSNSRYKEIMDRYGDEVDEYAKNFEGDENAYEKAASLVGMNHFDELVSEKAKEIAEQQSLETDKQEADRTKQSYTGVSEQPRTKSKKKNRVILKPHEKREFERQFALSVFDNKQDFYNRVWLRRNS